MTNMVNSLNASLALCEEENNSTMASDLSTALTEKKVREPMIFLSCTMITVSFAELRGPVQGVPVQQHGHERGLRAGVEQEEDAHTGEHPEITCQQSDTYINCIQSLEGDLAASNKTLESLRKEVSAANSAKDDAKRDLRSCLESNETEKAVILSLPYRMHVSAAACAKLAC